MKKILILAAVVILAGACTKKDETPVTGATANTENAAGAAQGETTQNIGSVGETMAFDKTEITVPAGKEITLTFKNNSTTLKHNWVLVKSGKENDVGMSGIKAGEANNFIPQDENKDSVIAHTKLVDPGQSDTITFTAPAAGDYPYICTNAGHHTVMKGVLHSK
jgi:azurin